MVRFLDLWRAHPFNSGDVPLSDGERLGAGALKTALLRAGMTELDFAPAGSHAAMRQQGEIADVFAIAAALDNAGRHGFGNRETLSLRGESDFFRAVFGRAGVLFHLERQPRVDVWNGHRSSTMGLARWVDLLTASLTQPHKASEMWFWPLPGVRGGLELSSNT